MFQEGFVSDSTRTAGSVSRSGMGYDDWIPRN